MRVDGEDGELRLLQCLWILVGRFLKQNTETCLEVDCQTGRVLATNVQTVGELQSTWLHNHGLSGRAQHVAGDQLEADEAA